MAEKIEATLIEKLNQASSHIGPIAKDGKNSYQKYSFQSETAIKYAVESAIRDAGIRIIPNYEVINQYDRKTNKGGVNHFVDVMGTFTITDGAEEIKGSMPGSGQDTGEKAMAKACTSAQKYFYKQLFNITDKDEDPDADDSNPGGGYGGRQNAPASQPNAPSPATDKQKDTLKKMFKAISEEANVDLNTVADSYLKMAKTSSLDQLTHDWANELVKKTTEKLTALSKKGKASA